LHRGMVIGWREKLRRLQNPAYRPTHRHFLAVMHDGNARRSKRIHLLFNL
jgi:hypothetical protein